jgi:hypothetical protein
MAFLEHTILIKNKNDHLTPRDLARLGHVGIKHIFLPSADFRTTGLSPVTLTGAVPPPHPALLFPPSCVLRLLCTNLASAEFSVAVVVGVGATTLSSSQLFTRPAKCPLMWSPAHRETCVDLL